MNRLYKTESAVSNIVGSLFLKDPFFNSIFFPCKFEITCMETFL